MSPVDSVADDEIVYRHVPGGPTWQVPPDGRMSSVNCRLRQGEVGLSVSRAKLTTATDLMARVGDPACGSRIAAARVGAVRALGFDVVPVSIPDDPGHAEIRPVSIGLGTKTARRQLSAVFQYV